MTPAEFVALCDRMSPDARLAFAFDGYPVDAIANGAVILTPVGLERIGGLLRDVEQIANH